MRSPGRERREGEREGGEREREVRSPGFRRMKKILEIFFPEVFRFTFVGCGEKVVPFRHFQKSFSILQNEAEKILV